MGQKSSSGTLYLHFEGKNGKPYYVRPVSFPLRKHMKGLVTYGWKKGITEVNEQAIIKIALPTRPLKLTEIGFAKVHEQVEKLMQKATDKLAQEEMTRVLTTVSELQPAVMKQLLGQVSHDILAGDDAIRTKKTEPAYLSKIILHVLKQCRLIKPLKNAQLMAQDVEFREARRVLAQDDPEYADKDFEEGEVELNLSQVEKILDITKMDNPVGKRLVGKARKAVFGTLKEVETLASDVATLLHSNNIDMPRTHPDRLQLGLDLARTKVAMHRIVQRRRTGDTTLTPERPPLVAPPPAADLERDTRKIVNETSLKE